MNALLNKAVRNPRLAFKIALMRLFSAIDRAEFVGDKGMRSAADSGHYVKLVRRASADFATFQKFKRHPYYMGILEHVTKTQGDEYLAIVKSESPEFMALLEDFRTNDNIGKPLTYSFGDAGVFSPTTLRYMKVASDLKNYFGDLTGFRVAEIGCGYGGQFLIIDKIWKVHSHTMFDLDPVLGLVSRYLESHLLRSCYHPTTLNRYPGDREFDLVISNYAFSELPAALERMYVEKVISKAKRGYLTMNSGQGGVFQEGKLTLEELREILPPFEIIDERPLPAPYNYIIAWGHRKRV